MHKKFTRFTVAAIVGGMLVTGFVRFAFGWTNPAQNPPQGSGGFFVKNVGGRRYLGANQQNPKEQLHISDGNLRIDGGLEAASGHIQSFSVASLITEGRATFGGNLSVRGGLVVGEEGLYPSQKTFSLLTGSTTVSGDVNVTGIVEKAAINFLIDHPFDPEEKLLRHSAVESPEMKTFYDGVAVLNERGETVVELPRYFEALNRDYRYQFMPLGAPAPGLYIKEKIRNNRFVITGGPPGLNVSWQVTGVRKDPWAEAHPRVVEKEKATPGYLYPELFVNP